MNDPAKVLVLGGYSRIGREITKGLLDQTRCSVHVTGRDPSKLSRVTELARAPRVRGSVLDATDREALARAAQDADVVVNCVGPYIVSGYEIASTVVESRRHYVDFAFEQFHYRRLETLDALAKASGVAVVTGAGEVVGLSSIFCAHAAESLPELESVAVQFIDATLDESETGFSGFMNGALEPALDNQDYVDGRYVVARLGSEVVERVLPEPYGRTKLLGDPSIDSLILPRKFPVRTVKNYFGLGIDIPFGFFPLMRLLNPYKRRFFYHWTARIVRRILHKNRRLQSGTPGPHRDALLRVEAASKNASMTIELQFHGGFNGTAILPILICRMIAAREVLSCGLLTALDLVTPDRLFAELTRYRDQGRLSWTVGGPCPS